jgi:hypothetical protein
VQGRGRRAQAFRPRPRTPSLAAADTILVQAASRPRVYGKDVEVRLKLPLLDVSLLFLVGLMAAGAVHDDAAQRRTLREYPAKLVVRSEISYKADLVEKLARPPQLVFIGGSRCERFDPVYAHRKTGLRSFNLATTNSHPEGAWALANWLLKRSPGTRLRWVWGINSTALDDRDLDPALLQDSRFSWYFDDALLRGQRKFLPHTASLMPQRSRLDGRRYSRYGLLKWNTYDRYLEGGGKLSASLRHYVERAFARRLLPGRGVIGGTRASWYFEKTLELLNQHGTTPVLVVMPVQPAVQALLHMQGWMKGYEHLLTYLQRLSGQYRFRVVDVSRISSFRGDPGEFYDGVHITRKNSDRVIDTLVAQAGDALR